MDQISEELELRTYTQFNKNKSLLDSLLKNPNHEIKSYHLDSLHLLVNELIKYLENYKNELIKVSVGFNEYHAIINPWELDIAIKYNIGQNNERGKAYELYDKLNLLKSYLDKIGFKSQKIAVNGNENLIYKHNFNLKDKEFAIIYFQDTNIISSIILINLFKLDLVNVENDYLHYVNEKLLSQGY